MKILEVTNMYPLPERPALGTFVKDQVDSVRKQGVDIDVFIIPGWKNKINYFWGIFRLWARLATRRYDLIHAHYVFSGIVARTQFLSPVVLTHHGLEAFSGWQRIPSRIISRLVDKVIVRTPEMQQKLDVCESEIIPAGIDLDTFKPMPREDSRERLGIPSNGKKLVLALWGGGEARPEKRLDIIKAAIAIAQRSDPEIELVLVTDKPHSLVPLYMNACDVLVLVSDAEGSPNVVKEAMACNMPVVSVPVGDVPELFGDADGYYLCSQEPADVAEKLIAALSKPTRTNGRERIQHLSTDAMALRIVNLYKEVLSRKKNHRLPKTALKA